jgi:DNA repair exonuclease SbcCD ATPase subunit
MATPKKNAVAPKSEAGVSAADVKKLEAAKKKFADAQKKLQEQRTEVTKAKRLIATGDKKIAMLDKKIEDTKAAPAKATEMLLKKAEEMEQRAEAMAAEQDKILKDASSIEDRMKEKEEELVKEKEAADQKLEELGVPKGTTRVSSSSGSAVSRRQKNNFQYRLKSKDWEMQYNMKGRIESASKYGLHIVFKQDEFTATGGTIDGEFTHPYGEGCITAVSTLIKDHGEGVDE